MILFRTGGCNSEIGKDVKRCVSFQQASPKAALMQRRSLLPPIILAAPTFEYLQIPPPPPSSPILVMEDALQ